MTSSRKFKVSSEIPALENGSVSKPRIEMYWTPSLIVFSKLLVRPCKQTGPKYSWKFW